MRVGCVKERWISFYTGRASDPRSDLHRATRIARKVSTDEGKECPQKVLGGAKGGKTRAEGNVRYADVREGESCVR